MSIDNRLLQADFGRGGAGSILQDKAGFKEAFIQKLQSRHGKSLEEASTNDLYSALGEVIRDTISSNWIQTNKTYTEKNEKQIYYFSMEFLLGRILDTNLINTGLLATCQEALAELGISLAEVEQQEPDAGLGNGGLGRLAACFMDSMAALGLPGHGTGIRYKYGLFEQRIIDKQQVELPDNWLKDGYIWEYRKADKAVTVKFGGTIQTRQADGRLVFEHTGYEAVKAVPYDVPIVGYANNTVNTLRLWNAEPIQAEFDLAYFNRGEYLKAVEYKQWVERISMILYPDDNYYEGRTLRLRQQYFFVSAGVQSIIRRFKKTGLPIGKLAEKVAIHINDTHPAVAIPELMRVLMDEEGLGWEQAWDITTRTVSYTNHTILPEALEKWPEELFKTQLPRIFMIVAEINKRYCEEIMTKFCCSQEQIHNMAILSQGQVNMAHLAVIGSYSVNGVAAIHTNILKKHLLKNFYHFHPLKFNNKTNGITHRRWLIKANPRLANLLTSAIGECWIRHPGDLIHLLNFRGDAAFQQQIAAVKQQNKADLAKYIKNKYAVEVDPTAIFDVQIKRIHAYKRQLLNIFHIMDLYNRLKLNPDYDMVPRVFIFAGKAAPGYYIAKQTIKLINTLAEKINNDPTIQGKIKVVFLENYSVSLGELVFPAADVSEQISTASKEASGTGNMKFMMNGAITIGTLDGANVEIRDAVGEENMFIFGLTAEEVLDFYHCGGYSVWDSYNHDERLKTVLNQMIDGSLQGEHEAFRPLYDSLLYNNDEYFVLKDFAAYADTQLRLDKAFRNKEQWVGASIYNIAKSGIFSSDRSIQEYADDIWKVRSVLIPG